MDGTARVLEKWHRRLGVMDEPWRMMLTSIADDLASAVQCQRSGDLDEAARLYEQVLARDPNHVDALHLMGLLRLAQGRAWAAADWIAQAATLRPEVAVFHATLAEAYRAAGQLVRSVECNQRALQLGLEDAGVYNNLGLALYCLGQHSEAASAFEAALLLREGDAMVHTNLGAALSALEDKEGALAHLRRAVEIEPKLAPARTNLGQLLLELDRPSEALEHCQAAVALQPVMAEAHNNLGNAYHALERLGEARWCYLEALRRNPKMPQPHASLGVIFEKEGDWSEALTWLRRATELDPTSLGYLGLLAGLLLKRDNLGEATACYKKMLKLKPDSGEAHNALGWLLLEDGKLDQAAEHLMTAITVQPDLSIARLNLGGVFEVLGDFATAESSFRAALADEKSKGYALARLALLLRGDLPDSDRELIEERLAATASDEPARVNQLFGLTAVHDAQGRYAQAAVCARQANELALANLRDRGLVHDSAEHERLVSRLVAAFRPELFARLAGTGLESRRPVFVVGLPRSGTSLIEQVLSSHSQFHGCGELPFARHDFEAIPELLGRAVATVDCIGDLTPEVIDRLAGWHLERLRQLDAGQAARVGDKMPENYLHLGLIALLFPCATIIHCRRDRRDVALSCWMTGFKSVRWSNDVVQIASRINEHDRLMRHWHEVLPLTIHEVDYEDAINDLESVARRLVAVCELDWEPACLDFHQTSRPVRTASFRQVRQPIYARSRGRWKNYESELADLFAALNGETPE
jgi:tetratricopeptide (TPR) repeat protein